MVRLQAFAEETWATVSSWRSLHVFISSNPKHHMPVNDLPVHPSMAVLLVPPGDSSQFRSALCPVCVTNLVNLFTVVPGGLGWFEYHGGLCECRRPWRRQGSSFCPWSAGWRTSPYCSRRQLSHPALWFVARRSWSGRERVSTEAGLTHREVPESKTER